MIKEKIFPLITRCCFGFQIIKLNWKRKAYQFMTKSSFTSFQWCEILKELHFIFPARSYIKYILFFHSYSIWLIFLVYAFHSIEKFTAPHYFYFIKKNNNNESKICQLDLIYCYIFKSKDLLVFIFLKMFFFFFRLSTLLKFMDFFCYRFPYRMLI